MLFDAYAMVDWSAAAAPRLGRDSIWIATNEAGPACEPVNLPTRSAAMDVIGGFVRRVLDTGRRALIGFDLGFGLPRGAARRIAGADRWDALWAFIAHRLTDADDNANNRFELAARLNREAFADCDGPFWGLPHQHHRRHAGLAPTRPVYTALPERRHADARMPGAQPMWKLAYAGSVGGQTLTGIARLQALRERFGEAIAVWPFQTRFADDLTRPVTLCEIYPSSLPVTRRAGEVKDAAQVRTVCDHVVALDRDDRLAAWLSPPDGLDGAARHDVLREEGWIAGLGR